MRITFDPEEAEQLRASARDSVATDPTLAYVLERIATEGIDLDECRTWDEIRAERGLPPLDGEDAADVA